MEVPTVKYYQWKAGSLPAYGQRAWSTGFCGLLVLPHALLHYTPLRLSAMTYVKALLSCNSSTFPDPWVLEFSQTRRTQEKKHFCFVPLAIVCHSHWPTVKRKRTHHPAPNVWLRKNNGMTQVLFQLFFWKKCKFPYNKGQPKPIRESKTVFRELFWWFVVRPATPMDCATSSATTNFT